jgi:hypothetical protein
MILLRCLLVRNELLYIYYRVENYFEKAQA